MIAALLGAGILALPHTRVADAATTMPSPTRVLDTRDGTGAAQGRLTPGNTLTLTLPSVTVAGSTSVLLNLTTVGADVLGYVSAWPCGSPQPDTSIVNFEPGRAVPNMVVLAYTSAGLCFAASSPVHLVADLTGVTDSGDLVGIAPRRLVDTRDTTRLAANTELNVGFAGTPGVPGAIAGAVANVTIVQPAGDGFAIVKPCGSSTNASTVNFRRGEFVAHLTFAALSGGALCVVSSVATDVIVDSFGYITSGSVKSLTPARLLDTRTGLGGTTGRIASGATARLQVTGRGNVPDRAIGAAVNVVAVEGRGDGFLTLWPCDAEYPLASTMNMWSGITRSNQAVIKLSDSGELCIRPTTANGSTLDVVIDVVGYVAGPNTGPPVNTTTTTEAPSTTVPSTDHFSTLPVGAALPSGAECADQVRDAPEIRSENAAPNSNRGGRQYANNRTDWPQFDRVDGDFAGTTDEIIQWAACKWGIDEDIARAQLIKESYWRMSANGDNGESWGLGQVRVPYHGSAFEFTQVNAMNSTAYNVDYTYASWRACYEGVYTWLGSGYGAGDVWRCVGVWFSGQWSAGSYDAYLNQSGDSVRWHYDNQTWLTPNFING
jgi:autotransporter family porin